MKPNPDTHKFVDEYCPYCFKALLRVIETGFTFCPSNVTCEYEVRPEGKPPITEIEALKGRRKRLFAEIERHQNCIIGLTAAYEGYGERLNKLLKEANDGNERPVQSANGQPNAVAGDGA